MRVTLYTSTSPLVVVKRISGGRHVVAVHFTLNSVVVSALNLSSVAELIPDSMKYQGEKIIKLMKMLIIA
jgi:hypothetical protein